MKFIANHTDKFRHPSVLFFYAWLQTSFCFALEVINVLVLYSSTDVKAVLGNYIALTVLVSINETYYNHVILADRNNTLTDVFGADNNPQITWKRGKQPEEDTFASRSSRSKVMRVLYNFYRGIFVVFIFYFAPLLYLVLN